MKTREFRQSAFSLVEVLVAMLIFGIGMLGLAALMTSNLRAGGGVRQRDTAAFLANDVLERLAADGRLSAMLRSNGATTFPTTYRLASATDNAVNTFTAADEGGSLRATFDLEGRPSASNPVFSVNWVRRSVKPGSATSIASSMSVTGEVLVNVTWSESGQGTTVLPQWMSCSRSIRY